MNIKKAGEEIVSETFTWLIENFSKLQTGKHYSDVFTIAGFKWRLLIWPKGNKVKSEMQFSVYLCAPIASTLEPGWARSADFSLSVMNSKKAGEEIVSETFTWLIENFSKLQTGKHYSDVFSIAGFKWRLLIWPKGNKAKSEMQFSLYLCAPNASNLEPG
ncbi:hypothetical protein C1H46_030316 [Malus baccata]|uniref:MATH domain-containing protein n=1 Tax=Malus baccata TaxID=106549 RepID=A0A540LCA6_MALBA|nr:hypothetical protein C1H46_030316 [Malus baccata]